MGYSAKNEPKQLDNYYPNSDLNHVYQKHRADIIEILNALEQIWKSKRLSDWNYKILYKGLSNSWYVIPYYIIGEELKLMIGKVEAIEKLIYEGISDSKWRTRFNVIMMMKGFAHSNIQKEIVNLAMYDKSKRVREMAIDVNENFIH